MTTQVTVRIQQRASVTGVRVAASGPRGLSAYEEAVRNGFVGDVNVWLASLQGGPGPAGDNFQPDATGLLADRGTYDSEAPPFAYLATDTSDLYFRETATAGVWSVAIPFGSGGGGITAYVHDQASASFTWTINHNLGYRPSVELYDVGGQEYEAEVSHISSNQVVVNHSIPTSGFARLL